VFYFTTADIKTASTLDGIRVTVQLQFYFNCVNGRRENEIKTRTLYTSRNGAKMWNWTVGTETLRRV